MKRVQVVMLFGVSCWLSPAATAGGVCVKPGVSNAAQKLAGIFFALALWLGLAAGSFANIQFTTNISGGSPDPLGHDSDPSLYGAFNGAPINYFDSDGRFGKQTLNSATGIDLNHATPFSEQLLAYRQGGQEWVGPAVDFSANLAIAVLSPTPPAYSPAEIRGLQSVGLEQFGSPMQGLLPL